jgi:hypothetical protein
LPSEKPPTLTDVARLAGVSVTTASRALNGGARGTQSGSPELRRGALDAARALGYSVNPAAQAIKDGARAYRRLAGERHRGLRFRDHDLGSHASPGRRGVSVAVRTTQDDPLRELVAFNS